MRFDIGCGVFHTRLSIDALIRYFVIAVNHTRSVTNECSAVINFVFADKRRDGQVSPSYVFCNSVATSFLTS